MDSQPWEDHLKSCVGVRWSTHTRWSAPMQAHGAGEISWTCDFLRAPLEKLGDGSTHALQSKAHHFWALHTRISEDVSVDMLGGVICKGSLEIWSHHLLKSVSAPYTYWCAQGLTQCGFVYLQGWRVTCPPCAMCSRTSQGKQSALGMEEQIPIYSM